MKLQHERRVNPYPWTWEIPTAAGLAAVLVMALALHLARGIANLMAGAGWQWPARADLFASLPGLLGGDAGAGLVGASARSASVDSLWTWIGVTEVALLVGLALALRWTMAKWGPGRVLGMATAAESEQLLGLARLRRHAAVIRPDLYGTRGR